MAEQNARKGKSYKQHVTVSSQLVVAPYVLSTKQISDWVSSLNSANNTLNPNRRKIYELFERVELDAQVETVTNLRKIAVTNKMITYVEEGIDEENPELLAQIRSPWFSKMIGYIMGAKNWGHSLIEFVLVDGAVSDTMLVPRPNVNPERGLALWNYGDQYNGIKYRELPESDYCFEVWGDRKLGLYSLITPYVLYKAGAIGDLAQFCELFSIPYREMQYNPYDPDSKRLAQQALEESGSAGYIVSPEGTTLKFHETKQQSNNAPEALARFCDEQIAKAFLGGTMSTDNGSSQAQATVHYDVKSEINLSDLIWVEYVLNWEVKPRLANFGLPVANGLFKFDMTREIPLTERYKMDLELAKVIEIPAEYWYKTYRLPEPEGGPKLKENSEEQTEPAAHEKGPGGGQKKAKKQ